MSEKLYLTDRDAIYCNAQAGPITRMEPYNLDDRGLRIQPGQRCKVTVDNADPIIFDRGQLNRILAFMDGELV